MPEDSVKKERFAVFTIRRYDNNNKSFWVRIGSAFKNKDGSLNVLLDAYPANGELHIRKAKQKDEHGEVI